MIPFNDYQLTTTRFTENVFIKFWASGFFKYNNMLTHSLIISYISSYLNKNNADD